MKKFISLQLAFLLIILFSTTVYAAETLQLGLMPDTTIAGRGNRIKVTVSVSGEASGTVLEIKPVFDSAVFELLSDLSDFSGADSAEFDRSTGFTIKFSQGVIPAGKVGSFWLRVTDTAGFGNYQISAKASIDGTDCKVASISITVSCSHSYGKWGKSDDYIHKKTCTVCGDVLSENHSLTNITVTKKPSCQENGEQTADCSVCGGSVNQKLDKTSDHKLGSCSDMGDGTHRGSCTVCGVDQTVLHRWDAGSVIKEATCVEPGEATYRCIDCGALKTEATEKSDQHQYGDWNRVNAELHERTCRICGGATEREEHRWDAGTVIQQPTCKDEGTATHNCTECIATTTLPVEKLTTHRYSNDCDEVCNICDETREGKHTYSKFWSMDQKEHWHQCTLCGKKKDIGSHQPGAAATETTPQICWLCEYVIKPALGHEHDYASELTIDEKGHWYACSGCEEKKDYEEHVLYNKCDPDCAVCSYIRQTEHRFSLSLSSDATGHWYACVECGEQSEFEAHAPGPEANEFEAQTCLVCDYEIVPAFGHTHIFSEDWITDQMHHWHQCTCGEKAEKDYHLWVNGVENDDGTVTYTCSDCQAETITGTPRSNAIWWILLIFVAVGGGAAAYWVVKRKGLFQKR